MTHLSPLHNLPEELGIKIEDMIFGQLKNADP